MITHVLTPRLDGSRNPLKKQLPKPSRSVRTVEEQLKFVHHEHALSLPVDQRKRGGLGWQRVVAHQRGRTRAARADAEMPFPRRASIK